MNRGRSCQIAERCQVRGQLDSQGKDHRSKSSHTKAALAVLFQSERSITIYVNVIITNTISIVKYLSLSLPLLCPYICFSFLINKCIYC